MVDCLEDCSRYVFFNIINTLD